MKKLFRRHVDDLLLLSGGVCICVSAFMVHTALGLFAVGVEMIALAVLIGLGDRNAAD